MSFQRISIIGSMPLANRRRHGGALQPVALVLEPVDLDEVRREVGAAAQAAQRRRDLLGAADEHGGDLLGLLHRRLDAVEAELVGRLLGVVDDVVERARRARARRPRRAPARRCPLPAQPVQDVVGDAVALLLAEQDLARQRGLLGIVREQVAQQQRTRWTLRADSSNRPSSSGSGFGFAGHIARRH